jgi:hypothetical protein
MNGKPTMPSKKLQREALRDPRAARAKRPAKPPPIVVVMACARKRSGAVRRCEPGEPITTISPDPWYPGYATALAEIWRLHHDGQMVRHILTAGGLTLKRLELGGVEERDLAAIRDACLAARPPRARLLA